MPLFPTIFSWKFWKLKYCLYGAIYAALEIWGFLFYNFTTKEGSSLAHVKTPCERIYMEIRGLFHVTTPPGKARGKIPKRRGLKQGFNNLNLCICCINLQITHLKKKWRFYNCVYIPVTQTMVINSCYILLTRCVKAQPPNYTMCK